MPEVVGASVLLARGMDGPVWSLLLVTAPEMTPCVALAPGGPRVGAGPRAGAVRWSFVLVLDAVPLLAAGCDGPRVGALGSDGFCATMLGCV